MSAVTVREAGPRSHRGDAEGTGRALRLLRARWRTASIAAGWRYPSDWALPEVDAVCASVVLSVDLSTPLASLGRARAQAGAGLDETLNDLAALHAVATDPGGLDGLVSPDPDATPTRLVRAIALAWADASDGELRRSESTESLTGMTTDCYLRTRLGEVYRQAIRDGRRACDGHVLLVVRLDLSSVVGWTRLMAMVLVAEVLREVFDGGESIAILGPSVAAVLATREDSFGQRALAAGWLIKERLGLDPQLGPARQPELRLEQLPDTEQDAQRLLAELARA
jgi:hypothetical protein